MSDFDEEQPKYVVFKQEDFQEALGTGTIGQCPVVDDAVVIRLKDPFAATALYTYANTIMSVLELMEKSLPRADHERMLDIADYFSSQASFSEKIKGKRLPD